MKSKPSDMLISRCSKLTIAQCNWSVTMLSSTSLHTSRQRLSQIFKFYNINFQINFSPARRLIALTRRSFSFTVKNLSIVSGIFLVEKICCSWSFKNETIVMIFWFKRLIDEVAISLRIVLIAEMAIYSTGQAFFLTLPSDLGMTSLNSATRSCFRLLPTNRSVTGSNWSWHSFSSLTRPVIVTQSDSVLSVFVCVFSNLINFSIFFVLFYSHFI